MNYDVQIEQEIEKKAVIIHRLSLEIERMNVEINQFLEELGVSYDEITEYLDNRENFSEETWNAIVQQKLDLEEKLQKSLKNIRNPLTNKKKFQENHVQAHWLFVK